MADESEVDAVTELKSAWSGEGASREDVDAVVGATKVCRNMQAVNFEAANFQSGSDTGADLGTVWRAKLAREGKIAPGSQSLGELIASLGIDKP